MISFNKYKQLLSAVLLLLYVFVAIPVQWLHYHGPGNLSAKQLLNSQDQLVFSEQDSSQGAEDCSICLHKYSSYNNDFFQPLINSVERESAGITGWIESYPNSNRPDYDNKGPPFVS